MSFGETKGPDVLPDGIPITGILGDQQAALFGQAGFLKVILNAPMEPAPLSFKHGDEIKRSSNGLLSTVAYQKDGKRIYALEGSCYIAGAAVQWLRDNLKLFPSSPDIEQFANQVTDLESMKNVLFLPFFTGIEVLIKKVMQQALLLVLLETRVSPTFLGHVLKV